MKRHLHLAMGISAFVLAVCCVAGAGLAWLRAAAGAVARAAMLCTVSEPVAAPPETVPAATGGAEVAGEKDGLFWFGATLGLDEKADLPAALPCPLAGDGLRRSDCAGPPGEPHAGWPARLTPLLFAADAA